MDFSFKKVSGNTMFCKTSSDKSLNSNTIMLTEENRIISNDENLSKIMNNYFMEIDKHYKQIKNFITWNFSFFLCGS